MKALENLIRSFSLLAVLSAPAPADTRWQPLPVPGEVSGEVSVLLLVVDDSGSMHQSQHPSRTARSVAAYGINTAAVGTYVIVAVFGREARVVEDRFVVTPQDRQSLCLAVEDISIGSDKTSVVALERLVNDIYAGFQAAYRPRGFRLDLCVLTDGQPDPVTPDNRTFDLIRGRPMSRSSLGGGLFSYTATFHRRAERIPAPIGTRPKAGGQAEESGEGVFAVLLAVGVTLGILLMAALLVAQSRAQRRGRAILDQTMAVVEEEEDAVPRQHPASLIFTEWNIGPDERQVVQGPQITPYFPNIPLFCGADARWCLFVLKTPGAPARLASLQLDGHGMATINPFHAGLRIDGQEVDEPVCLPADETHTLAVDELELHVEPSNMVAQGEDLFFKKLRKPSNGSRPAVAQDTPSQANAAAEIPHPAGVEA